MIYNSIVWNHGIWTAFAKNPGIAFAVVLTSKMILYLRQEYHSKYGHPRSSYSLSTLKFATNVNCITDPIEGEEEGLVDK